MTHFRGGAIKHTSYDKILLRSLHQEIDLFDRKLAHLAKYGKFPSEADRKSAITKMANKREKLVVTARRMAKDGVEYEALELPRSFRTDGAPVPSAASLKKEEEVKPGSNKGIVAINHSQKHQQQSPYAGTSLDSRIILQDYKCKQQKQETSGPKAAKTDT